MDPRTPAPAAAPWERRFIAVFVALLVLVPPVVRELYPFSLPSMFAWAIDRLARYDASDERGRAITLERLHLHVPEWHDPPVRALGRAGYGRRRPPSAQVLGEVATAAEIERAVRWSQRRDPGLPDVVLVRQRVMARGDDGALTQVSELRLRIDRADDKEDPADDARPPD